MWSPRSSPPLFPSFVAQHTVTFDPDDPTDLGAQFPGVLLPASLARAVRSRQMEFLAGRLCAREALRACAPERLETVVAIGPRGAPIWPLGVVGAITHTAGFASVAVTRTVHARAVGLDAERILDEKEAGRLLDQIADPDEVSTIARATGWSTATTLTASFSAKETIFKCLFAEVNRYFDFRDAWLEAFDPDCNTFRARLVTTLAPSLPAGHALTGRFSLDAGTVYTAMMLHP
ncbi:MAG TPA: 4'-phosphopantetheinyl transferase superfamily protein [Polyangiaceae bacterium]|nr:4'-phosphopantetheinyl transferase superfamily protein [Polyangiaceae bacterium]